MLASFRILKQGKDVGLYGARSASEARTIAERQGVIAKGENVRVELADERADRLRVFVMGIIEAMGLPQGDQEAVADAVLTGEGEVDPSVYLDMIAGKFLDPQHPPPLKRPVGPHTVETEIDVTRVRGGFRAYGRHVGTDYYRTAPSERAAVAAVKKAIELADPEVRVKRARRRRSR